MSNPGNRIPSSGEQSGNNRGANFDTTTGYGNRDPWNNPIRNNDGQNNNNDNKQTNNNTDKNDNGVNDDIVNNIWDEVKRENSNSDTNNTNNQQPQPNNNQQQVDPSKQLNDYLNGIGLAPITLSDEEKEQIQNGDFSSIMNKMHQLSVTAHTKALSGAKTMIDDAVKTAVAEATKNANSTFVGQQNLQALYSALPWTKDKAISPVAQTVMQKFLDRGISTEEAIKGVDKYFKHVGNKMSGNNVNSNRNGNFSSGKSDEDNTPEGGWLSILTGKQ